MAGAEQRLAIGQAERLEHTFGAFGHPLVLGLALLWPDDADQFDLLELVLADEAARVLARRARFGAEAGGERRHADRELRLVDDLLAHRIGQADFGGGDEPKTFMLFRWFYPFVIGFNSFQNRVPNARSRRYRTQSID